MQLRSLQARLTGLLMLASLSGALVYAGLTQWPLPQVLAWLSHDPRRGVPLPAGPGLSGGLRATMLVRLPRAVWLGG
ncbi:MAG: ATP-binding protein, partial [Frateuria sp.]